MFEIVVTEIGVTTTGHAEPFKPANVERFRQTVDALDMSKLIAAINSKPRKVRAPKPNAKGA